MTSQLRWYSGLMNRFRTEDNNIRGINFYLEICLSRAV